MRWYSREERVMNLLEVNKKTLRRVFVGVAACIVLYWLLNETESVKKVMSAVLGLLSPFITGACIAFIANVPMRFFEGKLEMIQKPGLRRVVAVILTFIAITLVLAVVFILLIPQLVETVEIMIPTVYDFFVKLEENIESFLAEYPDVLLLFQSNSAEQSFDFPTFIQNLVSVLGNSITTIVQGAVSTIGSVAAFVMNFVIALVFSIYCLFQKETLARQGRKLLYAFMKERNADYIIHILRLSNSTFSNFLSGQCIEVCILGVLIAIAMAILRMPYIPLVSVLVAVTAFIPIVGAWVGCVLGAFFMLVNDPMQAVWFVLMFLIVQQIEGNLIYPKVVGTSIGLSGMWVLVAITVGGELLGIAGMFLMIPFASVVQTIVREIVNNRLSKRTVDKEKLQPQPPELKSQLKEKRESNKVKRAMKKADKNSNQGN